MGSTTVNLRENFNSIIITTTQNIKIARVLFIEISEKGKLSLTTLLNVLMRTPGSNNIHCRNTNKNTNTNINTKTNTNTVEPVR